MSEKETTPDLLVPEFEADLERLHDEYFNNPPPEHGYGNSNNTRSPRAVMSDELVDCFMCTYCHSSEHCVKCTHCRECEYVYDSRYCYKTKRSSGCSYVIMSTDCHDCVFCFGCVGLVGKEFHILNKKYSRNKYFQLIEVIKEHLGLEF